MYLGMYEISKNAFMIFFRIFFKSANI